MGVGYKRCVESGRNRQDRSYKTVGLQLCLHTDKAFGSAAKDNLGAGVDVGHLDVGVSRHFAAQGFKIRFDRQHGARVAFALNGHGFSPCFGECAKSSVVKHTGSPKGRQFTVAVSGIKFGCKTCFCQQTVHAGAQGADGRLGKLRAGQLLLLRFAVGVVEHRYGINNVGEGLLSLVFKNLVHLAERLTDGRVGARQFAAHVHVLRTLSGEKCDDFLVLVHGRLAVPDAGNRVFPLGLPCFFRQHFDAGFQFLPCFVDRRGDKTKAGMHGGDVAFGRLPCHFTEVSFVRCFL